ncbi:MAG: DUF3800 domain-containing protein, partial [Nitrospira sp.]|nr:DUF3800 domain-containing protein [Nitrospira sp.]
NQGMKALNTPVLINLFSLLEGHGVRTKTRIDMIHDDGPYKDAFEKVFKQHKSARRTHIALPNGTAYYGYRHLISLRFGSSKNTPALRAADLLAGTISQHAASQIKGETSPLELTSLAGKVLSKAFKNKLGWVLVSYKFSHKTLRPIVELQGE